MNLFPDSENLPEHCPHCGQPIPSKEPIRLREGKGVKGVLQSVEPGEEGYILVNLSGFIVELPAELEDKLRPLMGQPTRAAFIDGQYRVAKWTRRPQT